jgi:mannitol/fructose-specific phosphotransferase system IIA component (Ntr-type)
VIEVLADTLAERGIVTNQGEVTDRLTVVEEFHTTGIGNGVAIPHATIEGVAGTVLVVAVADRPVEFGPTDRELCSVFFVLLSPPGRGGEHVRILARIARLASDSAAVERLRLAESETSLRQAFEAMDSLP